MDTVTQEIHIPSAWEYVRIQLAATPLATLMREQQASLSDAVVADVAALHAHIRDGALVFPQQCRILSAHRNDG